MQSFKVIVVAVIFFTTKIGLCGRTEIKYIMPFNI